ncbi:MAG: hypothetical protein H0X64_07720, partial [Gemmatimonadaceae bacterium]|nr:hypothetical protein [Gemmatimonadaceae bacterium]
MALFAALATAVPASAGAQIGGFIKKKVGDKVADRVDKALGDPAAGGPKFSQNVLEITGDRIDQLIRGVDAESAAREAAMAPFRSYEAARIV